MAHVVLTLDCGGLERIVLSLVREGARLGEKSSVICLERPGALASEVEKLGARVVAIGKAPGLAPRLVGPIRRTLRELRPDVVHTHQIGSLLYAGPAARAEGIRAVVHTEHINNIAKPLSRGRRIRARLLWWFAARYADRFFCVSEDIAVAASHFVHRGKLHVVQNGIDTSVFDGENARDLIRRQLQIPIDAKVVGTLGRLNEVKSQDVLIRAFSELRHSMAGIHLLLVGDGPSRQSLMRLAAQLGVAAFVHFVGYQSEPHGFLQAMDVFALPSRLEGTPLAILEAWAGRLPVVATRVGGIPQLVSEGNTGILIDVGDQSGLQEAISYLFTHPEIARRMAAGGRHRVEEEFDARRMTMDYLSYYHELLK